MGSQPSRVRALATSGQRPVGWRHSSRPLFQSGGIDQPGPGQPKLTQDGSNYLIVTRSQSGNIPQKWNRNGLQYARDCTFWDIDLSKLLISGGTIWFPKCWIQGTEETRSMGEFEPS